MTRSQEQCLKKVFTTPNDDNLCHNLNTITAATVHNQYLRMIFGLTVIVCPAEHLICLNNIIAHSFILFLYFHPFLSQWTQLQDIKDISILSLTVVMDFQPLYMPFVNTRVKSVGAVFITAAR